MLRALTDAPARVVGGSGQPIGDTVVTRTTSPRTGGFRPHRGEEHAGFLRSRVSTHLALQLAFALICCAVMLAGAPRHASEPPSASATAPGATVPSIEVRVDDRVTLLSIVARLAGADEYCDRRSRSKYSDAVDAHFAAFRGHDAVVRFREMRARHGVGYDAPMSLACHLGPLPALEERIDLAAAPERLDARWKPVETRAFLTALRAFVRDTKVEEFLASQRAFERGAVDRLAQAFDGAHLRAWCDGFFGTRDGAHFEVRVGLLCGPHSYGVGARSAMSGGPREEVTPVIGCWRWDAVQGFPTWPKGVVEPLIVHELCHSYVNAEVDRAWPVLEAPSGALLAIDEARMRRQAYPTPRIVCYETIVRACVVRFARARAGEGGERRAKASEVSEGFPWVPAVADALGEYERSSSGASAAGTARDFGAFLPSLAPVLAREAERLAR
jgi:hypothetical protein